MNRALVRRFALACATTLLLPLAARAADAPAPPDRRIDLDLVDAGADAVFAGFASVLGSRLDLDPALAARKLSIRLQNVRARTALDAACETLACTWRLEPAEEPGSATLVVRPLPATGTATGRPPLAVKLDEKLSLDLVDAPMETVLSTFAGILGARLDLDPALAGGMVTIHLTDVRLRDGLDAVLGEGWKWEVQDSAERTLRIRPRGR